MDAGDKNLSHIRKLRKKLRQIEHLERLERDLTDEEIYKCMKKDSIRESLRELLAEFSDLDSVQNSSYREAEFSLTSTVSTDNSFYQSQDYPDTSSLREDSQSNVISPDDILLSQGDSCAKSPSSSTSGGKQDAQSTHVSQTVEKVQSFTKASGPNKASSEDKAVKTKKQTEQPTSRQKEAGKSQIKKSNNGSSLEDRWARSGFKVTMLEGHNDLVTAVDCCESLLVSASRDTTVKVWDLDTLEEIRNLGSHTGSVTDVAIMKTQSLGHIAENLGVSSTDHVILSGSVDCSLNVWSVDKGQLLKSIYTYSPITKVTFCPAISLAVTASDGGKLELWNLDSKEHIHSVTAHSEAVSGLCVQGSHVFTGCSVNGEVKVFEVRDQVLHCIYVSENTVSPAGTPLLMRPIRGLAVKGENLYYGDDGVNLKILSWKRGVVTKVTNHREEFGMTDTICILDDLMMTSAYDLDNGQGYVNVFEVKDCPKYLATADTGESGRILDICCANRDNLVTMVTAGVELQVWQQVPNASQEPDSFSVTVDARIQVPASDSDLESEVEFTDSESEEAGQRSRRGSSQSQAKTGWGAWCNIV